MTAVRLCPSCGAELPLDAPEGLCPECLLRHEVATASPAASGSGGERSPGGFRAPEPAALAVRFPELEILEILGQGGMGAVYKARQRGLDRVVALKILPPEAGEDPAFAERFTREARALAKLNHPNIVVVHEFGHKDGLYYLIMEFVDGLNLRQLLRAKQFQPSEALKIVPQICEALQFAHDEGIVHRDIKPENILLDKRGRVKIADFGIAKMLGRKTGDYTLTGQWQVVGTLHYMAPEQMEKPLEVDHRADIYSLGVVFYEMLTGELPLGRFVPPSQKVQLDIRLDEVVLRTLEHEPEHRYQHASDVKTDVESIVSTDRPVKPRQEAVTQSATTGVSSNPENWPIPPGSAAHIVIIAVFMVISALCMVAGVGLAVYATLTYRLESGEFWGWMGGALGCIIGGGGSLVGCWNSYRQIEGKRDMLNELGRTWLDRVLLGYGLLGFLLAGAALVLFTWISWIVFYSLLLIGGIILFQAALFLIIRGLMRRSAKQEAQAATQPAPSSEQNLRLRPGSGPKLLLVALSSVFSVLTIIAGFGFLVYGVVAYPLGSQQLWGWLGAALGCILGGGGGLLGTWNSYRQWKRSG